MTTRTSARHIWASERADPELRAALAQGWRRADLAWERLQEQANSDLEAGRTRAAARGFRRAWLLSLLAFRRRDPRRATSLANAALAARLSGAERRAFRRYAEARRLWAQVPGGLEEIEIRPRARSSLFHLRMEARHWDTFCANMRTRLAAMVAETDACLAAIAAGEPPPHRLHARWAGEKPAVFDDTRKVLAACLLVAAPPVRADGAL